MLMSLIKKKNAFVKCKILSIETILSAYTRMHTHTHACTHTHTHTHSLSLSHTGFPTMQSLTYTSLHHYQFTSPGIISSAHIQQPICSRLFLMEQRIIFILSSENSLAGLIERYASKQQVWHIFFKCFCIIARASFHQKVRSTAGW